MEQKTLKSQVFKLYFVTSWISHSCRNFKLGAYAYTNSNIIFKCAKRHLDSCAIGNGSTIKFCNLNHNFLCKQIF